MYQKKKFNLSIIKMKERNRKRIEREERKIENEREKEQRNI